MNNMKKIAMILGAMILSLTLVLAMPNFTETTNTSSKNQVSLTIPENAVKISDNVYFLGEKTVNGKKAQGYAIITYKENNAKPGTGGTGTTTCYAYMSNAKWKFTENY